MTRPITLTEAKACYVHRFTLEHVPQWAKAPIGDTPLDPPLFYAPQYASDEEWYRKTDFPGEGGIGAREHSCFSSGQTWPLGQGLARVYRRGETGYPSFPMRPDYEQRLVRLWIAPPSAPMRGQWQLMGTDRKAGEKGGYSVPLYVDGKPAPTFKTRKDALAYAESLGLKAALFSRNAETFASNLDSAFKLYTIKSR